MNAGIVGILLLFIVHCPGDCRMLLGAATDPGGRPNVCLHVCAENTEVRIATIG